MNPPPPANPTITSFTADPATIQVGDSSTLTLASNNGSAQATVSPGNLSMPLNGTLSVSPTTTTKYTVTVNGASGTTPATSAVTVTVQSGGGNNPPPTITSVTPQMFFLPGGIDGVWQVYFTIGCENCAAGDTLTQTITTPITLQGTSLDPVTMSDLMSWSIWDEGLNYFQVDSPNGNSNSVPSAFIGDQNSLVFSTGSDGTAYYFAKSALPNAGGVYRFDQNGNSLGAPWNLGGGNIAVDNAVGNGNTSSGYIVMSGPRNLMAIYDTQGNFLNVVLNNGGGNGNSVDALNGLACATWTNAANFTVAYLPGVSLFSAPPYATQGTAVAALVCRMAYVNNQQFAVVLTADGNVSLYAIAGNSTGVTITPFGNPVALSGFTPESQIPTSQYDQQGNPQKSLVDAGWWMEAFNTGSATGTVAVYDRFDGIAFGINISGGQPSVSWTQQAVGYRIAADAANAAILLATYNGPPTTDTTYLRLDATTGAKQQLTSKTPSPFVTIGHGVHPATGQIWYCEPNASAPPCMTLANQ